MLSKYGKKNNIVKYYYNLKKFTTYLKNAN